MNGIFFLITKFFSVPGTSSGASARMKLPFKFLVTLGTSLEISVWSRNRSGAFPRISFTTNYIFPMNILKYSLLLFIMPVRISGLMNAQKISKFETEDKCNVIPFYTMDFFFLSREFSNIHSERFLTIFFYALFVFPE